MRVPLYIVGAGGLAKDCISFIQNYLNDEYEIIGFIDDSLNPENNFEGYPIQGNIKWLEEQSNFNLLIAIGNMKIRRNLIERLKVKHNFPTLVCEPKTILNPKTIHLGIGVFVAPQVILTSNISIGNYSFIHLACSLHHDTILEENVLLMPGCRITNGSAIKSDTRLDTGTCIY